MSKARHGRSVQLLKEENDKLNWLQSKGESIVDLFREGIENKIKQYADEGLIYEPPAK